MKGSTIMLIGAGVIAAALIAPKFMEESGSSAGTTIGTTVGSTIGTTVTSAVTGTAKGASGTVGNFIEWWEKDWIPRVESWFPHWMRIDTYI
jgi:hypothetical protein